MSYLKELKQHVIEVRGHVYDAHWKVLLLICRRGVKNKVSEFCPLHLKFIILTTRACFPSMAIILLCSGFKVEEDGEEKVCVSILPDAASRTHLATLQCYN